MQATSTSLRDQQLAGVLMWAYAGVATAVMSVALFAGWLTWHDRAESIRQVTLDETRGLVR